MKNSISLISKFFILFVLLSFELLSQTDFIQLKGQVVDAETGEGVAFASIGIDGTYTGVATNAEGFYELKIKTEFLNRKLYISAISYKNQTFNISEVADKSNFVIKLKAQLFNIDEVEVSAESMFLQKIIRTASENIPSNYLANEQSIKILFIHRKSVNNSNSIVSRFEFDAYDSEMYSNPSITSAFNKRHYKVAKVGIPAENPTFSESDYKIDELLSSDIVRSSSLILNRDLINEYVLNLEEKTVLNGDSIWIISYNAKNASLSNSGAYFPASCKGKIYISMLNYAAIKNEIYVDEIKSNLQGKYLAPGIKYNINAQNKITCWYSKVGIKYSLTYIETEKAYFSHDKKIIYESNKARLIYNKASDFEKVFGRDYFVDVTNYNSPLSGFVDFD